MKRGVRLDLPEAAGGCCLLLLLLLLLLLECLNVAALDGRADARRLLAIATGGCYRKRPGIVFTQAG